jgi:FAD binding domain
VLLDDNQISISGARRADVTGFGMPEHHGDGSALPMLVQSGNLSLEWSSGGCRLRGLLEMQALPVDETVLARRANIVAALRSIVPGEGVIEQETGRRPYESDGLTAYRALPMVVVLPDSVAQIRAVLAYCYEHNVKVVPRGAGTSLSGGTLPLEDGVLLSMMKFNDGIEVVKPKAQAAAA